MADTQVKSLVSEQYLDGWSYDDEDSGSTPSSPPSSCGNWVDSQTKPVTMTRLPNKRHHPEKDPDKDKDEDSGEPAEKKKFSLSIGSKVGGGNILNKGVAKIKAAPIKMNLSSQSKQKETTTTSSTLKSAAVAQAFGDDSEESEEEMPPEARMRMRNIGRETPTAAGPNSYGKGPHGFCDRQKIIERELQKPVDEPE